MSVSLEEMRERINSLSDQELIDMVEVKFRDYNPEAINIANEIAQSRGGLSAMKQRIADTERQFREEQKKEEERERKELEKRHKFELSETQHSPKGIRTPVSTHSSATINTVSEGEDPVLLIRKRHKTIRVLMRIGNFVGWLLCITIIGLPIGLTLLYFGHITLVSMETEHNTREMAALLREYTRRK